VDENGTWNEVANLTISEVGDAVVVEGKQVDGSSGLEVGVGSGGVGRMRNEEGVVDALIRSNRDVDHIGPLSVK
jgi:hypothetical protein